MADEGRVMREDQASAEVREQARARHAARIHAGRDRLPECEARVLMRVEDAIAHAMAEALHGATGMPVYEWCERELRIEEPAVLIEATVEAPLQVRSVTLDDYVRHMQRSRLQVFMGLDTQVTREATAHETLRQHIEAA